MIEVNKKTSTLEPVEGQAPAPGTDTKGPASTNPAASKTPAEKMLPSGYLEDGVLLDEEGVMRSEYIGRYAEEIASALEVLPASTFYSSFLRERKGLRKKKIPHGAQKNCAMGMVTAAKKLVYRKKDPPPAILLDIVTAATATVKVPATFESLYMHLDAIYSNMLG